MKHKPAFGNERSLNFACLFVCVKRNYNLENIFLSILVKTRPTIPLIPANGRHRQAGWLAD